jgi:heterodisulfide reductase subunit A-like polyferredoxin
LSAKTARLPASFVKSGLANPDASGRRKPVPIEGAEFELPVDMVVPAIGQGSGRAFGGLRHQALPLGTIEVNEVTYETSRPGVFAAGDVHTGPWIAIEAVGGGIEAAESIDRYLRGADMVEGRAIGEEAHKRWAEIPKDEEGAPREVMAALPPEHTCACFDEIAQGYTEEQAQREAARCLNCGVCSECMQCVVACQAGAIDHTMQPETKEVQVGAVILSPGFQAFSPVKCETYHYSSLPNVVTSLEFERILSASGPFGGHLVRPSDHAEPKKIAWLQCVGSRDVKYHTYCSSVCCMYAIKEAVIAKEHAPYPLDTAIFFMDMRTFGKDFELYYNRAKDEHGVRFIRSRIHSIDPLPNGDLAIRFADESGEEKTETFNLVVLSVGMEVSQGARELSSTLKVDINAHDFVATSPLAPVNGLPGRHLCLRSHAGSQRHSRIGYAGVGCGRGGERLFGGRPLDRDQDPAGAHTQGHQSRRRPPHRGVRLQLRHQHRRHRRRAGAVGILQDAAQRGVCRR